MLTSFLVSLGLLLTVQANTPNQRGKQVLDGIPEDHLERNKRLFVKQSSGRPWPKAIMPYQIEEAVMHNKAEYERIIALYEARSCVRMPYWNASTPAIFGLNHKGRMNLIRSSGCYSTSKGKANGPISVSCCGGHECIHEIGHTLGFSHEQSNPLRDGWIRSNYHDIWPSNVGVYKKSTWTDLDQTQPYDITTIMHYKPWMYGVRGGSMTSLFPELQIDWEYFYFFMEVAYGYKCETFPQCNGKMLNCENDGYQTILHGKCACMCPTGLDPDNACKTPLKHVTSAFWPKGQYALPKPETGCPTGGSFQDGQLLQSTADGNSASNPSNMLGEMKGTQAELNFCTRTIADDVFHTEDAAKFNWPIGNYCIYMKGDSCPTAFSNGTVEYTVTSATATGQLPEGSYSKTKMTFNVCCQYRGFHVDPVSFPTDKPFALIRLGSGCQQVTGMRSMKESFTLRSLDNFKVDGATKGWVGHGGKSLTVPLCYYRPADMDCGGSITLTEESPVVTIEMKGNDRTDVECTWIIKGERNESTLVFDFEEFNVKKQGRNCVDNVEVRHSRIGQYGLKYCGERPDHSIRSITNKLLVRFSTTSDSPSSFKARIRLTDFSDMCYDAVDKRGLSYDGTINYTRTFDQCLPWAEMTDCYHHPFLEKDVFDSLDGNACRNPDNSFRPWCYTAKYNCQRNYCDVCGIETPYDKINYCNKLKEKGFCTTDAALALKYCAKTCFDEIPGNNIPAKKYPDITCSHPSPPSDGVVVGEMKLSYKLGETVQYKCNRGPSVVTSRCMTSGQWSELGSACLQCPIGSKLVDNTCYILMQEGRTASLNDAVSMCKSIDGTVVSPKNQKEATLIVNVATYKNIWIKINDIDAEGTWVHDDGTKATWFNWNSGEPNNVGNEDCAVMNSNTKWNDLSCNSKSGVVCSVTAIDAGCEDILGSECSGLLKDRPTMCTDLPDLAKKYCARTCRACPTKTAECSVQNTNRNVLTLTTKSKILVGEAVDYRCVRFTYPIKGAEHQACLPNWELSGEPLQCGECPIGFEMVNNACHGLLGGRILSFKDAQEQCKKMDGFVAMPKTQKENDAIASLGLGQQLWVGATDGKIEGEFFWEDGSSVTWSNWINGEPKGGRSEDCAMMNSGKTWTNVKCGDLKLTTVCSLPKSGEKVCYDRTDKGATYNGRANVTNKSQPCIDWANNCNKSPFKRDYERSSLEANYCRNPDNSDGPWCYTKVKGCSWQYCDVCDTALDTTNIVDVKCGPPLIPSDGEMMSAPRSSYKLGDEVTLKCKRNKFVVTTTCLTSGDWSPVGYACTECPVGYYLFNNTCYGFVDKQINYDKSIEECSKIGGHLPRPKSLEENNFIQSINHGKYTWIDAKRYPDNNYATFQWSDGTAVNWLTGKATGMLCGFINEKGIWGATTGDFLAPLQNLICAVPKLENIECKDFLGDQCEQLLTDKPSMCQDQEEFAKTFCRHTCGICGDVTCKVAPTDRFTKVSTTDTHIAAGQYVQYSCKAGTFHNGGDAQRACTGSGKLTGSDVQCDACPVGYERKDGFCYGFIDRVFTFTQAAEECSKVNGFVASPKNEVENDLIDSIRKGFDVWLGASDARVEGDFRWQDGTKVEWVNWGSAEPSNYGGYEDCVVLLSNKKWNDQICDSPLAYNKKRLVCSVPILGEEACYDTEDKGATYGGQVSVTEGSKACIPWATATKCPHNPFSKGDERKNLVENYCRNPDESPGPWCYIDADTCDKKYCSVCDHDPVADYTQVKCKPPTPPSDGVLLHDDKFEYNIGDAVEIGCKKTNWTVPMTKTCLTNGLWTPLGIACTVCPAGYELFQDQCYHFEDQAMSFMAAHKYCFQKVSGYIASPKTPEQNEFVNTISNARSIWIGLNDMKTEGTWLWEDGTQVTWNNWEPGEPNDWGTEDAGVMKGDKHWNDIYQGNNQVFVCATPKNGPNAVQCEDFLQSQCSTLLAKNPDMCKHHLDFALEFCALSCNTCSWKDVSCGVTPTRSDVIVDKKDTTIKAGESVKYSCSNSGLYRSRGDQMRTCLNSGDLSGLPYECKDVMTADRATVGPSTLTNGPKVTPELNAFFGVANQYRIEKKGLIIAWEYYSSSDLETAFQVWRRTDVGNVFQLVGQTIITTPSGMDEHRHDLPVGHRIEVQRGDLIGIANGGKGGVRFTACDENTHPEWTNEFYWSKKVSSVKDYKIGSNTRFNSGRSCVLFPLRAIVAVIG